MTDSRGSHDFPHRSPAELWQEFVRTIPRACPARPGQCLVKYRYAVLDVAAYHRNATEHKHEDRENMQYTSPHSEGCPGVPVKRKESQTQHDTISNIESHDERNQEPLMVTQEAVEAYKNGPASAVSGGSSSRTVTGSLSQKKSWRGLRPRHTRTVS